MLIRFKKGGRGFTLIELFMTMSLFAVVSIAIYATFASGMKIWNRAKEVNLQERRAILRIERMCRELRQMLDYEDIPFLAKEDELSFAEVVNSQICRITYVFDAQGRLLLRGEDKFVDILAAEEEENELVSELLPFLIDVEEVAFSYFYFDLEEEAYLWMEEWEGEGIPLAVKLTIKVNNEIYSRVIFIPIV